MRLLLLSLFTLAALGGHAQDAAPLAVPERAVAQLEKMRRGTLNAAVIGKRTSALPAEARPMLNRILVQSATDFLLITTRRPTREAYLSSLDAGLSRLAPLVSHPDDRAQVAEYYQDLLDIVGLESSEGRLTAFVESGPAQPQAPPAGR